MANVDEVHIGELVKAVFKKSGMTVKELATQLNCERTNIYTIFRRRTIDVELLAKLSKALHYNFLDEAMKLYGLTATFSPTLNLNLLFEKLTMEHIHHLMQVLEEFKKNKDVIITHDYPMKM